MPPVKIHSFLSWLLESILIKADGFPISRIYHHVIDETISGKYDPLNPLEYE